jgi:hypothetical protein
MHWHESWIQNPFPLQIVPLSEIQPAIRRAFFPPHSIFDFIGHKKWNDRVRIWVNNKQWMYLVQKCAKYTLFVGVMNSCVFECSEGVKIYKK